MLSIKICNEKEREREREREREKETTISMLKIACITYFIFY